jgi:leucyl aminopeptidase (aminopeptidase T)
MATNYHFERAKVAKIIMDQMFQVKPGETVAITADSGSDREIIDALAAAAYAVGGKPLVMWFPKARDNAQAGMPDWPSEALIGALSKVDVWLEAQSSFMLYSDIWETAMKQNKKLRYLIIADSKIESLVRIFASFDIQILKELLHKVKDKVALCKKVRITTKRGTDVTYEMDPSYLLDIDDGDYSMPKFGTAPGYVNVVPKTGSMNGRIIFDRLMHVEFENQDDHVEFIMKDGTIVDVVGNIKATNFKDYLAAFEDPNMYKISHNMFGLNPGVQKISGDIVEDERIWGGVDFGFGHTSSIDMPPNGQVAKSHFDGVLEKVTITFDDEIIVKDGNVCHPDLKDLADKLLTNKN